MKTHNDVRPLVRTSCTVGVLGALTVLVACASDPAPTPPAPVTAAAPVEAAQKGPPAPTFRLPDDVTPTRYVLDLTLVPENDTFRGTVNIDVTLANSANTIWLHGAKFEIDDATFTPEGAAPIVGTFAAVDDHGLASLALKSDAPAGKGTITIRYRGEWDTSLKGLYKVTEEGKAYVFTQLEPLGARFAFPCFDEPRFKVPFSISVTTKREHTAIGNTKEISREDVEPDLMRVQFAETLPLPTYLLAFAVGPLDVVDEGGLAPNDVRKEVLPFRGVAVSGRGPKLAYAMKKTGAILTALERYFGMAYPFDKLDIIAIPDFASGAMENPGAVTFREWLLLVDEVNAPANQKRAMNLVMAHELAHMWFGDLVTMPWWDDLWLNEAFATWMAYRIIDEVEPTFGASIALVERGQGAMGMDALVAARQIRQPVNSEHDVDNAFDSITYSKGGMVLGMFEALLTKDVFQNGIRTYVNEHSCGNATTEDLLGALSKASGTDVNTPFLTFLEQPGVPLVEASLVCEGDAARVDVKQSRYLPPGSKGDANKTWRIPVCVHHGDSTTSTKTCAVIDGATGSIPLPGACPRFFFPNADGAGYFKVVVDEGALLALLRGTSDTPPAKNAKKGAVLKPPTLSSAERLAVADAVRTAFSLGRLDTDGLLRVVTAVAHDPERTVSKIAIELLTFLHDEVVSDKERAHVENTIRAIYKPVLARLTLEPKKNESPDDRAARAAVADLLARVAKDPDVEAKLSAKGRAYLRPDKDFAFDPTAVDADLTPVALQSVLRTGDDALFDAVLEKFQHETDAARRVTLMQGLAAVTEPARATKFRNLVFDPDVRTNEIDMIVLSSFFARENRVAAWEHYQGELDRVIKRAPTTRQANLVWMGAWFCTDARAKEVSDVFASHIEKMNGGPRELESVTEAVSLCAARASLHRAHALKVFATKPELPR